MTARSSGDFADVGDLTERERLEIADDRRRVREIHTAVYARCNKSRRDSLISVLHADLRRFRLREHTSVECSESSWAVPYTCLYALKYVRVYTAEMWSDVDRKGTHKNWNEFTANSNFLDVDAE